MIFATVTIAWAMLIAATMRRPPAPRRLARPHSSARRFGRARFEASHRRCVPLSDAEIAQFVGSSASAVSRWEWSPAGHMYQRRRVRKLMALVSTLERTRMAPDAVALRGWLLLALRSQEARRLARVLAARGVDEARRLLTDIDQESAYAQYTGASPLARPARWRSPRRMA